jgi:phage terminase small subunit
MEEQLTDKQKRFAEEYLISLNATAAAARAGYSDPNYGRQILTIPNVLDYIEKLQKEQSERAQVTADRVINEFAKLGFSNIKKYHFNDWSLKPLDELEEVDTACIQSVKTTVNEGASKDGEVLWKKTTVELKMHSKQAALDSLAKHTGIYKADNQQKAEGFHLSIEESIIRKPIVSNEEPEA